MTGAFLRTIRQAVTVTAIAASVGLSAQSTPPSGLIVGQVVDAGSGKPVSGAIVRILSSQPPRPGAGRSVPAPAILTGSDGRFVFRDLPAGSYNITAVKNGYADGAYGRRRPDGPSVPLTLVDGERTADPVLLLWKHATISGTVVDEAGEPVVRAQVRAWRRVFSRGRHTLVPGVVAATNDRGVYRLTGVLPGDYIVGVPSSQLPGPRPVGDAPFVSGTGGAVPPPSIDGRHIVYPMTFYPSVTAVSQAIITSVASGDERAGIDLQLQPVSTARVSGTVTRGDGPVAGMRLQFVPIGNDELPDEHSLVAAADGQGAFAFPAVPQGQYVLRIRTAMLIDQKKPQLLTTLWAEVPLSVAGDVEGVVVTVRNGARITGRLEFEGSRLKSPIGTVDQIPLLIDPVDRVTIPSTSVRVDSNGQFATGGLPPGRYFVRVSGSPVGWMFKSATHNGRDVSETPLELYSDDVHVVLTYTDRWTGIAGTVTSASGSPDADATVLVFPADPDLWSSYGMAPRRLKSTRTRKTGEYNFNSLPPGRYHIVAVPDEQAADWPDPAFLQRLTRISTPVTIADGEQTTRSLRTQVIR